jgi:hypothetical protein
MRWSSGDSGWIAIPSYGTTISPTIGAGGYLAQQDDRQLRLRAMDAAAKLSLPLEVRFVGYGALKSRLVELQL